MNASESARAVVRDAGGVELLERLDHLDAFRSHGSGPREPIAAPDASARTDFDVVIAGGGLWSLLAPILAGRGLRVAVFDRARAAQSHREWNASGPELAGLVKAGVLDDETLAALIVARYDRGICRFAGGGSYPVRGVLDSAIDAAGLLGHGRRLALSRGVHVFDGHRVEAVAAGPEAVRVQVRSASGEDNVVARVLVDARGVASPFATADLVCPTVGGVVSGLVEGDGPDENDPATGEILATIDGIDAGRQHIWEAFPGRRGQVTVYLFYYARRAEPVSLADLYARFFSQLPRYKRGEATLVRPTFGLIPGWSRLSPAPQTGSRRILLVGDAAARHSPLTCCGFGGTLRSLERAATAIVQAVTAPARDDGCIVDDAPLHSITGALAYVMACRTFRGDQLNTVLDAAFRTLHDAGESDQSGYARFLRDELTARDALSFLRKTARRHPAVWRHVMRALGPRAAGRWAVRMARAMRR